MISIIIPVYNQSRQLARCLASIEKQTYDNFEIIIVNDRSTQKMSKMLGKYKKIFGIKLELINNQSNHGAPYSRNKGFKKSKGEFVVFCDADIVILPQMLEKLHNKIRANQEIAYVYSSHKFGGKKFENLKFSEDRLKQMPFIHTTALIRRKCFPVRGFDESLKRLQDWDLWLTMLESGHRGEWLGEILFKVESGGTMSSWMPSVFYRIFPFLPKVIKYKKAVKIIKNKHKLIGPIIYNHRHNKKKIFLKIVVVCFIGFISLFIFEHIDNGTMLDNRYINQSYAKINNIEIPIEVVNTAETRRLGLSYRESLDASSGMLFDMKTRAIASFWMKDMNFPLDIIWIDGDKIVNIDKSLPPGGSHPDISYSSKFPVDFVLEVNGGFCDTNNIKIGDKLFLK